MTPIPKTDSRILWVLLAYNWETKSKRISLTDEPTSLELEEGERLYRASFEVSPPGDGGETKMEFQDLREEWETRDPKPDSIPMEAWVARQLGLYVSQAVPPYSYGPGGGLKTHLPLKGWESGVAVPENYMEFELPGKGKFRVTVEKVPGTSLTPQEQTLRCIIRDTNIANNDRGVLTEDIARKAGISTWDCALILQKLHQRSDVDIYGQSTGQGSGAVNLSDPYKALWWID